LFERKKLYAYNIIYFELHGWEICSYVYLQFVYGMLIFIFKFRLVDL